MDCCIVRDVPLAHPAYSGSYWTTAKELVCMLHEQAPRTDTAGYQPIENYGIIGDLRTVALVGIDGSIDWYCYPYFDSPSVFAALLDHKKGGRFVLASTHKQVRFKQFYWPDTNVLVTRFLSPDGVGEVQDFMPVVQRGASESANRLIRRV